MPKSDPRWNAVLECNNVLRSRLLTWELLLFQLANENFRSDTRLITILQFVRQLLEQDLSRSFATEELGLYSDAEEHQPDTRNLVQELRQEHDDLREGLESMHRQLSEATFETSELVRTAGMQLAEAVRTHMRREEEELIPALVEGRYRVAG